MSFHVVSAAKLPTKRVVDWLWEGYVGQGTVALIGGPGGVGKSTLIAALEVAVAAGIPFLESSVKKGEVVHVDFDTDSRLQGPWYSKVARGLKVGRAPLKRIQYLEPKDPTEGFSEKSLKILQEMARQGPRLIVLDSWASAFPYLDPRRSDHVAEAMAYLKELARTGPAVVILDHTPKPMKGLSALERGIQGSFYKVAGARSAFLLSRVPPKLTKGGDVLRLDTIKNNLAPLGDPIGIARIWEDGALRFELTELPEGEGRISKLEAAKRAILEVLEGGAKLKAEVVKEVSVRSNAGRRTIEEALRMLVTAGALERLTLGGKGAPAAYRLVAQAESTSPKVDARLREMDFTHGKEQDCPQTPLREMGIPQSERGSLEKNSADTEPTHGDGRIWI